MTLSLEPKSAPIPVSTDPAAPHDPRQQALLELLRRAAESENPDCLCRDAARAAAEALALAYCLVGRGDGDGGEMLLKFYEPARESGAIEVHCSTEPERSLIGYALHCERTVVVPDLDEESRFADALLTRRSIRSAVAAPLIHGERRLGVLAVLGRRPRDFLVDEVCYFELLARLTSTALARAVAESELSEQRMLTRKMLESTEALVVTLTPQLRIRSVNPAFERAVGFPAAELCQRPLSAVVSDGADLAAVKQALDLVRGGEERVRVECNVVTRDGPPRRVAWSYTALTRPDGGVEGLIGTGQDITEHCEAQARLEKVESLARAAGRRLIAMQRQIDAREPSGVDLSEREAERRRNLRVPFPRMQEIAPIVNGKLPDRSRFLQVRFHDISGVGFSFFLPQRPDFEELVVALGEGEQRKYVTARVLHATDSEHEGRPVQLVGCSYTGRLELISNSEQGDYFVMVGN